ncbi:MAG: murein hydrolase activator EnvC family protein [Bacilli bacterium]
MKKIIRFTLLLLIIFGFTLVNTQTTSAKTLADVRQELKEMKDKANDNKQQQQLTDVEIKETETRMKNAIAEIESIQKEYQVIAREIEDLGEQINSKKEESKNIIRYLQISKRENIMLDYIFSAEDPSEFIYKSSVVNRLTEYNTTLMEEMKVLIEQNKAKDKELQKREVTLSNLRIQLVDDLESLGEEKEELYDGYTEIEEEIRNLKATIDMYEDLCKSETQDLDTCVGGLVNTSFRKPTRTGRVTSEFGYRYLQIYGYWKIHYGIDVGVSSGTELYSIGHGIVSSVSYDSCGGNTIWIIHKSKGKYYSSGYLHLSQTLVKVGDEVTSNTMIGRTGNTGSCTTGPHLHLAVTTGARYVVGGMYGIPSSEAYTYSTDYKKRSFDARNIINFPAKGVYWSSR